MSSPCCTIGVCGQHQLVSWEKAGGEVIRFGGSLTCLAYTMGWAEAKSLYGVRLARLSAAGGLGMGVEQSCTLELVCYTVEEAISAPKMLTDRKSVV